MSDMPSLSVTVLKAFWNSDDLNTFAAAAKRGFFAGAEALVAHEATTSSRVTGIPLDFGPFSGDSRGGCLNPFDEA